MFVSGRRVAERVRRKLRREAKQFGFGNDKLYRQSRTNFLRSFIITYCHDVVTFTRQNFAQSPEFLQIAVNNKYVLRHQK